jgi:hypothetical protein
MRRLKPLLVAGLSAAALAGVAGIAVARSAHFHTMTVQIPDGGVAEIRYSGDQPPQVVVSRAPAFATWAPAAFSGWVDPFADFDRIAAQMDRQMDVMLRQARALEASPGLIPRGADGYRFVSSGAGGGFCGRSVEITSQGDGKPPHVVSHTWGDCGDGSAASAPTRSAPAPAATPADGSLVQTQAVKPAATATGKSAI